MDGGRPEWGGDGPIFVIQAHDASTMHYDVRLEVDGTLASWAVPKGPSTDPREKRLAIRTEDHPLGYADFEGVIPQDQYGGGTVQVWDRGRYDNVSEKDGESLSVQAGLEAGKLKVYLHGEKLRGAYAFIYTGERDGTEQWLLIKVDDDQADARRKPTHTQTASVKTERQLHEIRAEEGGDS